MCKEDFDISLYVDNILKDNQNEEIKNHLEKCDNCKYEYLLYKKIKESTKLTEEVPIELHNTFMDYVKNNSENKIKNRIKLLNFAKSKVLILAAAFVLFAIIIDGARYDTRYKSSQQEFMEADNITEGETFFYKTEEKDDNGLYGEVVENIAIADEKSKEQNEFIDNYYYSIRTENFDEAIKKINSIEGNTINSSIDYASSTYAYIEKSVEDIDVALESLQNIGKIISVSNNKTKVSEEYIEKNSRYQILIKERQNILEYIKTVNDTNEIAIIEASINELDYKIGVTKKELNNLEESTNYPLLTVEIESEYKSLEMEETFFEKLQNSFSYSLNSTNRLIRKPSIFAANNFTLILTAFIVIFLIVIRRNKNEN